MEIKQLSTQKVGQLTVVQFETHPNNTFDYRSSAEATQSNLIQVREISEQGSVNNLAVENPSEFFIFFMDGDILVGAKQDRVLNTSILVAPKSKTIIPVSCVEQGRWKSVSMKFKLASHAAPASLRQLKSRSLARKNRRAKDFAADQGAVWQHVAAMKMSIAADAPTDSINDVYEKEGKVIEEEVQKATCLPGANGIGIFLGDNLVSLDVLNRSSIYAEYYPRLLRGALLDTFTSKKKSQKGNVDVEKQIGSLLERAHQAQSSIPSVGVGVEERFEASDIVGFRLTYENQPIHVSLFGNDDERPVIKVKRRIKP